MLEKGTSILMTKGYNGVKGEIIDNLDSPLEFYVVRLENGMHPVVGPSAFEVVPEQND
jgi:hypothetical protein